MNALVINCSPVRTGATAEIVKIVSERLSVKSKRLLTDVRRGAIRMNRMQRSAAGKKGTPSLCGRGQG